MDRYQYQFLDSSSNDIRLVTILPDHFDAPIQVNITHAALVPPTPFDTPGKLSLKETRQALPEGWSAYETLEGRVIFESNTGVTTWTHPNPSFGRGAYDPVVQESDQPKLQYEALSYTWGSLQTQETVVVKPYLEHTQAIPSAAESKSNAANLQTSRLPISRNLAEAIRYLRHQNRPRVIWIDAICINQNDIEERNVQVKRMNQIYSLARRVVAWLGPGFPNSELVISTLKYLGKQTEETRDNYSLPSPGCNEPTWYAKDVVLPYGNNIWDAIHQLASLTWFKRLWIVQEIHLGSSESILKCGHDEILFSSFRRAIICIWDKNSGTPQHVTNSLFIVYRLCDNIYDFTFHRIILDHNARNCSDPRDKIYGLMSLSPLKVIKDIKVDYNLSPMAVFTQVFLVCSQQEKRFTQLPTAGRRHIVSSQIGSTWVPDWSQNIRTTISPVLGFCASSLSSAQLRQTEISAKLEVTALYVGIITSVGSTISSKFSDIGQIIRSLGVNQLRESRYPTGETYLDAYVLTMTTNRVEERYPKSVRFPTLVQLYEEIQIHEASEWIAESRDAGKVSDWYKQHFARWTDGNTLFNLSSGHLGMIYGKVQKGKNSNSQEHTEIPYKLTHNYY